MSVTPLVRIRNLNSRPYIQGAMIVEAVLNYFSTLDYAYPTVSRFELRIHKPLHTVPTVIVQQGLQTLDPAAVVTGSFLRLNTLYSFKLLPTRELVTEQLLIDEQELESRMRITANEHVLDCKPDDNALVCWSALERTANLKLFNEQGFVGGKMWFTGITFYDLSFMREELRQVSSSVTHMMLSPRCVQRFISYNGKHVGTRVAVYTT